MLRRWRSNLSSSLEERYEAVARLPSAQERCERLVTLGLQGFCAAPTQLGYLLHEAEAAARAGLERLAAEASGSVQEEARRRLARAGQPS